MATDSEVLYEGYFYKLCGYDKKKVFNVQRYSWKERYLMLIRRGETATLAYFDKKPKTTEETPRGSLDLRPSFSVSKIEKKKRPFACEIVVGTKKLTLAADSELDRDCLTFHIQTQARLNEDVEHECFSVRPDGSEDNRKIGARGSMCYLHISQWGVTLALQVSRSILAQWPLSCIRCYECLTNSKFSIETGRRSPMGQGHYVFSTRPGLDHSMYEILDQFVMKAAGLLEESPEIVVSEVERQMVSEYDHLHLLTSVHCDGMFSKQLHRISRDNYDHLVLRNRDLGSKNTTKKKSEVPEIPQEDTISTSSSQEYREPSPLGGSTSKPDLIQSPSHNASVSGARVPSSSRLPPQGSLSIPRVREDSSLGATGGEEPRMIPGRPPTVRKYPTMHSSNSECSDLGPDQYLSFSPSAGHPSPTTPGSEDFMSPPPSFSEVSQYSYSFSPETTGFINETYQNESQEQAKDQRGGHNPSPTSSYTSSAQKSAPEASENIMSQKLAPLNQKVSTKIQNDDDRHNVIPDEYLTPGGQENSQRGLKSFQSQTTQDSSHDYLMASSGHQEDSMPRSKGQEYLMQGSKGQEYLMPGSRGQEYLMPGSKGQAYLMPKSEGQLDTYLLAGSEGPGGQHVEYMLPAPGTADRCEYLAMHSNDPTAHSYSKQDYLNLTAENDGGYGAPVTAEDYLLATDFHYMSPQSRPRSLSTDDLTAYGNQEANSAELVTKTQPGYGSKPPQQTQTVLELKKMFSLKKSTSNPSLGEIDFSQLPNSENVHAEPNMASVKPASRFPPHPSRKSPKAKDSDIVPSAQSKSFKKPTPGSIANQMPGFSPNQTPSNFSNIYPSHMAPTTNIGETLC
ncbi:uncharacterized protein LOC106179514 [Lingula anatina]|uniref:Uncharacterized protein LOC106179514 n=1 Tax=Lingula anatina TaxID=7574 RepID=A0A1S3K862_LINAN|nr:uncharacterized protein LOC106179514 [Lingula anatina]|eukprot:XP_013418629.1 uncharacterized protein LOC106179514 [Lingula anatina]